MSSHDTSRSNIWVVNGNGSCSCSSSASVVVTVVITKLCYCSLRCCWSCCRTGSELLAEIWVLNIYRCVTEA